MWKLYQTAMLMGWLYPTKRRMNDQLRHGLSNLKAIDV